MEYWLHRNPTKTSSAMSHFYQETLVKKLQLINPEFDDQTWSNSRKTLTYWQIDIYHRFLYLFSIRGVSTSMVNWSFYTRSIFWFWFPSWRYISQPTVVPGLCQKPATQILVLQQCNELPRYSFPYDCPTKCTDISQNQHWLLTSNKLRDI